MAIQYKKIITEIMGPEAEKRGYTITSHGKLLATRPMAYFCKEVDGQSVMLFEITEYLIGPRTLFLRCQGKEIHLKYEDEESFRECINQFNEYMLKEGYEQIEEMLKVERHAFSNEDYSFVADNYSDVYEANKKSFIEKSVYDSIKLIESSVKDTYGMKWEDARPRLLEKACILVGLMLERNENIQATYLKNSDGVFLTRREGLSRRAFGDPCHFMLISFDEKDAEKYLYNEIIKFFTEEELKR